MYNIYTFYNFLSQRVKLNVKFLFIISGYDPPFNHIVSSMRHWIVLFKIYYKKHNVFSLIQIYSKSVEMVDI